MRCKLSMRLEFSSPEDAKRILDSVSIDNGEWISARQEDNSILCEADAETVGGILHTAEDLLSCVALAEKMLKQKDGQA